MFWPLCPPWFNINLSPHYVFETRMKERVGYKTTWAIQMAKKLGHCGVAKLFEIALESCRKVPKPKKQKKTPPNSLFNTLGMWKRRSPRRVRPKFRRLEARHCPGVQWPSGTRRPTFHGRDFLSSQWFFFQRCLSYQRKLRKLDWSSVRPSIPRAAWVWI